MTTQEIKNYFTENYGLGSRPTWKLLSFGSGIVKLISIILLAVFSIITYFLYKKKVTAYNNEYARRRTTYRSEYDKMVKDIINDRNGAIKGKALSKLGLDEEEVKEIKPIIFWGWDYSNKHTQKLYWENLGNDEYHANKIEVSYVFLTKDQMALYVLRRDLQNSKDVETTEELFYTDVTNIKMDTSTIESQLPSGKKFSRENVTVKIITGGDSLQISVNSSSDAVESSVKAMRSVLREHKVNPNRGY